MDGSALRGRHVLVTGATTPLARALAVRLAEAGATVSVTTSRAELAQEVQANSILNETWSVGSQGRAMTVDLTSGASIESAIDTLEREIAPIDALINIVDVHGTMSACLAAAERMFPRRAGRIVNVVPPDASEQARAAVLGLTNRLTDDWEQRGLTLYTLMIDDPESAEASDALVALASGAGEIPPAALPEPAPGPGASDSLPPPVPRAARPLIGTPGPTWGGDGSLRNEVEVAGAAQPAETTVTATGGILFPPPGLQHAPLWRRAAAWGIDFLLKTILFDVVMTLAGIGDLGFPPPAGLVLGGQLLSRGYDFIFFMGGRSPGGMLLGLRIVRAEDGGPPGAVRALLRSFGAFLTEAAFGIGFLWALRRRRQNWQDAISSTLVVRNPRRPR